MKCQNQNMIRAPSVRNSGQRPLCPTSLRLVKFDPYWKRSRQAALTILNSSTKPLILLMVQSRDPGFCSQPWPCGVEISSCKSSGVPAHSRASKQRRKHLGPLGSGRQSSLPWAFYGGSRSEQVRRRNPPHQSISIGKT